LLSQTDPSDPDRKDGTQKAPAPPLGSQRRCYHEPKDAAPAP
jgi:hypothetical protein